MKISFIIPVAIVTVLLAMTSCNREELARSNQQNDSLVAVINQQDAEINGFISSFNEVETNLDSVAARQQIIHFNVKDGELKAGQKERINAEIEAINELMIQNRNMITELSDKLKKSSRKNAQMEKTIATLNRQYFQKNLELTNLNDQLNLLNLQVAKLQTTVDTLTTQNFAQSNTIMEKNKDLHTAYYIVGKSKELQEANLIDKQGGLLGIGRTSKLNSDVDNSKFFRIDYTQTNNIVINSNKVKIITNHPSDAYTLNKDAENKDVVKELQITNPEKFWSASKYLVIVNN